VSKVVERLLADQVLDRIHQAGRLLRLSEKYSPERLNNACQRALNFDDPAYKTVKNILKQNLDQQVPPSPVSAPPASAFLRQTDELVGDLAGVTTWN
jgi:hypothetical protein